MNNISSGSNVVNSDDHPNSSTKPAGQPKRRVFGPGGLRYDEECERCRRETVVCNNCGCCERHCNCYRQ